MQEDMSAMEYVDPETGYMFVWRGGTKIDVGMPWANRLHGEVPEGVDMPYQFFANISVYDPETGKMTIPPTYEAFKARVLEWIQDEREANRGSE